MWRSKVCLKQIKTNIVFYYFKSFQLNIFLYIIHQNIIIIPVSCTPYLVVGVNLRNHNIQCVSTLSAGLKQAIDV